MYSLHPDHLFCVNGNIQLYFAGSNTVVDRVRYVMLENLSIMFLSFIPLKLYFIYLFSHSQNLIQHEQKLLIKL